MIFSKITKILLLFISIIFHFIAFGLIIYFIYPIAKWYLDAHPIKGVDLFLSGTYVANLLKHFALRFNGWSEFWFAGVPYYKEYPSAYFYLMVPFAKHFGIVKGIQIFAVTVLGVFGIFSYLLYYQLSKNRILSLILTISTIFSANLYRSLLWAGGIPFWTTQAFFPIVFLFIVKFCQTSNYKYLYIASAFAGFAMMGHPQNVLNLILPCSFILLLFWRQKPKITVFKRILDLLSFGFVTYVVALPETGQLINPKVIIEDIFRRITNTFLVAPSSTGGVNEQNKMALAIQQWTHDQFRVIWDDAQKILFYLLAVSIIFFIVSFILRKKRVKSFFAFLAFALTFIFVIGGVYLFSRGIDLYITGWYKAFWPTLSVSAMFAAFAWGESKALFKERKFFQKKAVKVFYWIGVVVVNAALVGSGIYFLMFSQDKVIGRLAKLSSYSSAFPNILNVKTNQSETEDLARQFMPKLLVDNVHDYRLYATDATFNIWWGGLEEMPLTRGYVDPPLTTGERWAIFWLDSILGPGSKSPTSSLIEDWHTPKDVAYNNLRFLIDWTATKYLEGNHLSAAPSALAQNITTDEFIDGKEIVYSSGGIINQGTPEETWSNDPKQDLVFYRFKQELVSPILTPTNASSVLLIGDAIGYDTLTRFLGMVNLGPNNLILARGPEYIDDVSLSDLSNFDAVILYRYKWKRKGVWTMLGKYLDKGGKVFVDTGTDVKESNSTKYTNEELPDIFPIKKTTREDLGKDWRAWHSKDPVTQNINFSQFTPLDFDGNPWNVSHPPEDGDLRDNSKIILKQANKTIMVRGSYGQGTVYWCGFNLPYHLIRGYNWQEAALFVNILSELTPLNSERISGNAKWISSGNRSIDVTKANGVILKEQAWNGWNAWANARKLKIYKVGPNTPGYMYVRLPNDFAGSVEFRYTGSLEGKLYFLASVITVIVILDYVLGGKIFIAFFMIFIFRPLRNFVQKWWEKEGN